MSPHQPCDLPFWRSSEQTGAYKRTNLAQAPTITIVLPMTGSETQARYRDHL